MNQTGRNVKAQRPCRCIRSKCLKLYCGCFSSGVYCDGCSCMNCQNNFENDDTRSEAMACILDRRAKALGLKIAAISQRNSRVAECSLESVGMERAGEKRRRDESNDPDREKRRKMMTMMKLMKKKKEEGRCHVPEEIQREIMLKLPVKSLIRFRSANKRLRDLISDKQFIAEHIETFEPSALSVLRWRSPTRSCSP